MKFLNEDQRMKHLESLKEAKSYLENTLGVEKAALQDQKTIKTSDDGNNSRMDDLNAKGSRIDVGQNRNISSINRNFQSSKESSPQNQSITDQILCQVRRLKANNLKIQSLTQGDVAVLDETSTLAERGVTGIKRQNIRIAQFISRTWKHTGMYWFGILVAVLMFMFAFLMIKFLPHS
jgi:hypothetical protein